MSKYQEDYYEFIKDLKYINELINSLTIEQRKSLGATTYSIQGILGRYINEEKDFVKELVDRETPKKPTKNDKANHDWNRGFCPNCGQWLSFTGAGCINNDCRQRLDWSNEE